MPIFRAIAVLATSAGDAGNRIDLLAQRSIEGDFDKPLLLPGGTRGVIIGNAILRALVMGEISQQD